MRYVLLLGASAVGCTCSELTRLQSAEGGPAAPEAGVFRLEAGAGSGADANVAPSSLPDGAASADASVLRDAAPARPWLEAGAQRDAATPRLDGATDGGPDAASLPRIAGRLLVRPSSRLDLDRGGTPEGPARNDLIDPRDPDLDQSQSIPNPAWVSGSVGASRPLGEQDAGGVAGGLLDAGDAPGFDAVDYYRVQMRRAERVTLYFEHSDLDLYLLDREHFDLNLEGGWVDDSVGSGVVEQVTAPRAGQYWVAVVPGSGTTEPVRYALTVGVPNVLVSELSSSKLSTRLHATAHGALVLAEGNQSGVERGLVPPVTRRQRRYSWRTRSRQGSARDAIEHLKWLQREYGAERVQPLVKFSVQALPTPSDPEFAAQWHHAPIDLLSGWASSDLSAEGSRGAGTVVAVLDTGIARSHPDFVNSDGTSQLLPGFDMVSDVEVAGDGDGRDADPEDPGDGLGDGGGSFHGTHCAGNIAAAADNALGIVGVAPNARILPVRVLGRGGGDLEDIVEGILFAAGLPNASGLVPEQPADVISLSLAGPGRSELLADAIRSAREQGAIVVAAAGNYASAMEDFTPAAEPGVVSVSAVDAALELAAYSNVAQVNGVLELSALGGDLTRDRNLDERADGIFSLLFKDSGERLFGDAEGTSMAAAQVAGVVALMKGVWPEMTPSDFDVLLPRLAIDLGPPGQDPWYGHGLINAAQAVGVALEAAGSGVAPLSALRLSATALDFGTDFDVLPVWAESVGAGVELSKVQSDSARVWLEPGELGLNWVYVDRVAIEQTQQLLRARVDWTSTAEEERLAVLAAPSAVDGASGDLGPLQVELFDEAGRPAASQVTTQQQGYAFDFGGLPPGRYRFEVSSADRAGAALGIGDAHGAWPMRGQWLCHGVPPELESEGGCSPAQSAQLVLPVRIVTGSDPLFR